MIFMGLATLYFGSTASIEPLQRIGGTLSGLPAVQAVGPTKNDHCRLVRPCPLHPRGSVLADARSRPTPGAMGGLAPVLRPWPWPAPASILWAWALDRRRGRQAAGAENPPLFFAAAPRRFLFSPLTTHHRCSPRAVFFGFSYNAFGFLFWLTPESAAPPAAARISFWICLASHSANRLSHLGMPPRVVARNSSSASSTLTYPSADKKSAISQCRCRPLTDASSAPFALCFCSAERSGEPPSLEGSLAAFRFALSRGFSSQSTAGLGPKNNLTTDKCPF